MPRYIDADALREKMFHKAFEEDSPDQKWDSGCWIRYHMFEDTIESIPTADVVERKRGKWIRHSIGHENTPWGFDCSACGKWFVISEDSAEKYRYCPNCGAEMRKETEDV